MRILSPFHEVNIVDQVKKFERILSQKNILTLCSSDHIEHISAFIAWNNVGGNIFIKAPFLTEQQSIYLDERVKNMEYENSLFFHTSGTTGTPKIAVHQRQQLDQCLKLTTQAMQLDNSDIFLNFLPAFTVGFWNIILPSFIHHRYTIRLGSYDSIISDLQTENTITCLVPSLINLIKTKNTPIDFSQYKVISSGSSAVLESHTDFLFDNGCQKFNHMYGTTEITTPVLFKVSTSRDDEPSYLDLNNINSENEIKFIDNILYFKGKSLCANINDFHLDDGWFNTNDIWFQENNLIRFKGRTNDVVKINGYRASLLDIESITEEKTSLGETLAKVKNTLGIDYIELFYTNKYHNQTKKDLIELLKDYLPNYSIPKKFTYIEQIPKNGTGKKLR